MIKAQFIPAILLTLLLTVFTGFVFPLVVWALGQIAFPYQANGSLLEKDGKKVGSEIIGQNFSSARYFHPRPSAAGAGYDPLISGGTNLGPTSKKLFEGIADDPSTTEVDETYQGVAGLAKAYREENGLAADVLLPVDAVTRSSSGLDPHISLQNAQLQKNRVARERALPVEQVEALIAQASKERFLGIFGEKTVNVLELNLALDAKK